MEVLGWITLGIILIICIKYLYRLIIPYNESNCPYNHDNIARSAGGWDTTCPKCGTKL